MSFFPLIFLILLVLFIAFFFVRNSVNTRMDKILKDIDAEDTANKENNNLE